MNENQLINIIKNITQSQYIGDDCAYLKELGIVITQDSLIEDIHFRLNWIRARELGAKSVLVNISDILASGAEPAYISISLSLPSSTDTDFVREFYIGVQETCNKFGAEICGGDLTGADKVFVSVCAVGKTQNRNISSRSNAKFGYNVAVCGLLGSSAAGLQILESGGCEPQELISAHKTPVLYPDFSKQIAENINAPYAMMDTSDGLCDALLKIALASNATIEIDYDKIPKSKLLRDFDNERNLVLFGGEDYALAAAIPSGFCPPNAVIIGRVTERKSCPLIIKNKDEFKEYSSIDEFTFNHFL